MFHLPCRSTSAHDPIGHCSWRFECPFNASYPSFRHLLPPPPPPSASAAMKLLGWMHRKLRPSAANDLLRNFDCIAAGGPGCCLPSPDDHYAGHDGHLFPSLPPAAEPYLAGDSGLADAAAAGNLFVCLLAIGTLGVAPVLAAITDEEEEDVDEEDDGVDPIIAAAEENDAADPIVKDGDAPAPEAALDAIAEKAEEATTEGDLMIVCAELEKVLAAESGGGGHRAPSVSARPSFTADCPLQGFLLGSPAEPPDPAGAEPRARRVSLGELFMSSRVKEELAVKAAAGAADGGREEEEKKGKFAARIGWVEKVKPLEGKGPSLWRPGLGCAPAGTAAAKVMVQKILQIFHRKVHPESSEVTKRYSKNIKLKNKGRNKRHVPDTRNRDNEYGLPEDHTAVKQSRKKGCMPSLIFCSHRTATPPDPCDLNSSGRGGERSGRKECMPSLVCCSNRASLPPDLSDANGSGSGHWIKTDADYLVLEL